MVEGRTTYIHKSLPFLFQTSNSATKWCKIIISKTNTSMTNHQVRILAKTLPFRNGTIQLFRKVPIQLSFFPGDPWPLPWDWTKSPLHLGSVGSNIKQLQTVERKSTEFCDVWFPPNPNRPIFQKNTWVLFFLVFCSKFFIEIRERFSLTVLNVQAGWGRANILLKFAKKFHWTLKSTSYERFFKVSSSIICSSTPLLIWFLSAWFNWSSNEKAPNVTRRILKGWFRIGLRAKLRYQNSLHLGAMKVGWV